MLSNGVYEMDADLIINNQIELDSTKRYVIFVNGKLTLDSGCVFSSKANPSRNIFFITDSLSVDKNAFISASFISSTEFTQIGEMRSSKSCLYSRGNIYIRNDSTDLHEFAVYFHPNFVYKYNACTIQPEGCNLVLNPGFSNEMFPPTSWGDLSNGACCNWTSPTAMPATPDFFHVSGTPQFNCPAQNGGSTYQAFQPDHGIYGGGVPAYAGLYTFNPSFINAREYIQGTLHTSLTSQKKYYGEFYASRFDISNQSASNLGMFVSPIAPTSNSFGLLPISGVPQIENNSSSLITSSNNWTLINGCFTAIGGENFVTIGNFYDDFQTLNSPINPPLSFPFQFNVAHYLIDDVTILPIEVDAGPDVTVDCLGTTIIGGANCLESHNPGQFTYNWTLISGSSAYGTLSSVNVQYPVFTNTNSSATIQTNVYQVQITTPGGCSAIDQISITLYPMLVNQVSSAIGSSISNQTLVVIGDLTIDNDFIIDNCILVMGQNSSILVNDGINLKITSSTFGSNSHLYACQDMWQGIILLGDNASLTVENNTLIEDAINGIYSDFSASISVSKSKFMNNYIGINLNKHDLTNPVTIVTSVFNSNVLTKVPYSGLAAYAHIKLVDIKDVCNPS